jgi:hypothetical protein
MNVRVHPTSLRFTDEQLELLHAWATLLTQRRATRASRIDVISFALKNLKPPDGLSPAESAVRRAHEACFDQNRAKET